MLSIALVISGLRLKNNIENNATKKKKKKKKKKKSFLTLILPQPLTIQFQGYTQLRRNDVSMSLQRQTAFKRFCCEVVCLLAFGMAEVQTYQFLPYAYNPSSDYQKNHTQ